MNTYSRAGMLVEELGAPEVYRRMHARNELVALGTKVTPALVQALSGGSDRHRWEVCKTLILIKDPQAAPALVEALCDGVMAVRWVAAEALIAIGPRAEAPLLHALEAQSDSVLLREGAHHVLCGLDYRGVLGPQSKDIFKLLGAPVPGIRVGLAAHSALEAHHERVH